MNTDRLVTMKYLADLAGVSPGLVGRYAKVLRSMIGDTDLFSAQDPDLHRQTKSPRTEAKAKRRMTSGIITSSTTQLAFHTSCGPRRVLIPASGVWGAMTEHV